MFFCAVGSDIIVGAAGESSTAPTTKTAFMTANASHNNISQIEPSLWDAADPLRANSKLTFSDYCILALGVIFLRHDLLRLRLMSGALAV